MTHFKHTFITFEGIEGSGKSTQSKKLHEFLLSQNMNTILTREPGGTKASEQIRNILISDDLDKLEAKTELLLNFAARLEHVEKLIKPALANKKIVISDRFFDSTFANLVISSIYFLGNPNVFPIHFATAIDVE